MNDETSRVSPTGALPPSEQPVAPRQRSRLLRFGAPFAGIAAVALVVLLLSRPWQSEARVEPGSAARREAERLGALDPLSPKRGEPAPDFALRTLDGQAIRLSELRGQTVLVNFWATWCGPCRGEMPDIEAVYRQQKDLPGADGLVVLAINEDNAPFDEARRLAIDFRDELELSFPILVDAPEGEVFQQYRLRGMPSSFIIDARGVIREIKYGPFSREELLRKLQETRKAAGTAR